MHLPLPGGFLVSLAAFSKGIFYFADDFFYGHVCFSVYSYANYFNRRHMLRLLYFSLPAFIAAYEKLSDYLV